MRAVNITDQTQVVAEAAITAEPGVEVDWPDDLNMPATFKPLDAEKADDEQPSAHRARRGRTTEENR